MELIVVVVFVSVCSSSVGTVAEVVVISVAVERAVAAKMRAAANDVSGSLHRRRCRRCAVV